MQLSGPIVLWDGEIRPKGDVTYVVASPWRLRRGLLRSLSLGLAAALALVTVSAQVIGDDSPPHAPTAVTAQAAAPVVGGAARAAEVVEPAKPAPRPGASHLVAPVSGLSAPLARSLAKATQAAAAAGIDLEVTSGYRTRAEQQRLFDEAVRQYGSAARARRWVLPPSESEHVKGRAVDVGPRAAARWLEANGVKWGLCRRYVNEWWHFERLAPAVGQKCPALEPNAAG